MGGKRGEILNTQARRIVLAVDDYFEQERSRCADTMKQMKQALIMAQVNNKESNDSEITLPRALFDEVLDLLNNTKKVTERVVTATGISKNTVTRIRGEGNFAKATSTEIRAPVRAPRGPKYHVDIGALKDIIKSLSKEHGRTPTVGEIWSIANKELNFTGGKSTLRNIINNNVGRIFQNPQNCEELIKQPKKKPRTEALDVLASVATGNESREVSHLETEQYWVMEIAPNINTEEGSETDDDSHAANMSGNEELE